MATTSDAQPLVEGAVVQSGGRAYRVGMVNSCRARLDPLEGIITQADPSSGRTFLSYGSSINVAPTALMKEIDITKLDDAALERLCKLQLRADTATTTRSRNIFEEGEEDMAEVAQATTSKAVAPPVGATKTKAQLNSERLAQIRANKSKDKEVAKVKREKKVKDPSPCKCGCGQMTGAFFIPGHDARFKGWLLKIEKGEKTKAELLTPAVIAQYKWIKVAGGGERPTTNYKGEAHSGYSQPKA